jgi:regulator of protease activity HflC (stomatin/prohibitin superfamily)
MLSYVVNIIRSAANGLTMDEIFQSKDEFETAVTAGLKEQFEKYGYEIINVLVDDPQPSDKLREAFDEVLASKRRQEAAINDAEATRTRMVGEASAEGESLKIKARAYVEQRDIIAAGVKAAASTLDGIAGLSTERIFNFLEGIDWRDAIRDASKGPGSTIVVPVNFGHGDTVALTRALQPKAGEPSDQEGAPAAA